MIGPAVPGIGPLSHPFISGLLVIPIPIQLRKNGCPGLFCPP